MRGYHQIGGDGQSCAVDLPPENGEWVYTGCLQGSTVQEPLGSPACFAVDIRKEAQLYTRVNLAGHWRQIYYRIVDRTHTNMYSGGTRSVISVVADTKSNHKSSGSCWLRR